MCICDMLMNSKICGFYWIFFFANHESERIGTLPQFGQRVIRQFLTDLRIPRFYSKMKEEKLVEVTDLLTWNKRMLALAGIWPKDATDLRFTLSFIYVCIHVALEYADLVHCFGDLERILNNLTESTTYTMLLFKMAVFRKNRVLIQMIDAMNEDITNHKFKSLQEQKIYAMYNSMAKNFFKLLIPLVIATAILYYLRPLAGYLITSNYNNTTPFVLPYRTRFVYKITNAFQYAVVYAYQAITLHLVSCGFIGTDGLLISLTLHVCGQLSILAENIANFEKDTKSDRRLAIRSIVKRHLRLIWMARKIDTAFTIILLGQLLGSSLLICLNGFNVIMNSQGTPGTSLVTFGVYEATMLTFLYSYCFVSECLIQESKRVHDAFYLCTWYEMPSCQSKDFIICMARSQRPLYLTAGRFYIFSLESFTQVIKKSMAFLSVLRNLI